MRAWFSKLLVAWADLARSKSLYYSANLRVPVPGRSCCLLMLHFMPLKLLEWTAAFANCLAASTDDIDRPSHVPVINGISV